MALYQLTSHALKPIAETTFGAEGILERKDLQRMLREDITVLDEGLKVVAEEFGDWVDSNRRIDLLCIDKAANLVVVELKRTEDGGHMELQALRYAAMVARMTFEQLVDTYARFTNRSGAEVRMAEAELRTFVEQADEEDIEIGGARIVLAAADFGKELTTCVMWLNEYGLDIRCVRMKPYRMESGLVLLDVEQIIPLPETQDYQTQVGVKKQAEQEKMGERHRLRRQFWEGLLAYAKTKTPLHANRSPTVYSYIAGSIGRAGFSLNYAIGQHAARVELWIKPGGTQGGKNKTAFKALEAQKEAIENDFGTALDWQELPESDGSRISFEVEGGYRSPQDMWPDIHARLTDAMIRLDKAMRARVGALAP